MKTKKEQYAMAEECKKMFREGKSVHTIVNLTGFDYKYVFRHYRQFFSRTTDTMLKVSKKFKNEFEMKKDSIEKLESDLWVVMERLNSDKVKDKEYLEMRFETLKNSYAKFCL